MFNSTKEYLNDVLDDLRIAKERIAELENQSKLDLELYDRQSERYEDAIKELGKQLAERDAQLKELREELARAEDYKAGQGVYCLRLEEQLKVCIEALKAMDKFWFQPGPERGCCGLCDGGIHPDWLDKHEPTCQAQIAHEALKQIGAEDV